MKNYYEILEVDKKASPEVIEKAYKTLVKKYHPDLQNEENHTEYEEKMKKINEAYSVLSDDFKKSSYDQQIQETTISIDEYNKVVQENQNLRTQLENINARGYNTQNDDTISRMRKVMYDNIKQARAQAYNDAYKQDMRNRGYTIKYKHDLKYYIKFAGCICIVILVLVIAYQIPIVKRFCNQLYEENVIIQSIVNIFKRTFSTKI